MDEEKLNEREKIKSEQDESLNILPESTLISTSQRILNNTSSKTKINIGLSTLFIHNNLINKKNNN